MITIAHLPQEILSEVLKFFTFDELAKCERISKQFRNTSLNNDYFLWKAICEKAPSARLEFDEILSKGKTRVELTASSYKKEFMRRKREQFYPHWTFVHQDQSDEKFSYIPTANNSQYKTRSLHFCGFDVEDKYGWRTTSIEYYVLKDGTILTDVEVVRKMNPRNLFYLISKVNVYYCGKYFDVPFALECKDHFENPYKLYREAKTSLRIMANLLHFNTLQAKENPSLLTPPKRPQEESKKLQKQQRLKEFFQVCSNAAALDLLPHPRASVSTAPFFTSDGSGHGHGHGHEQEHGQGQGQGQMTETTDTMDFSWTDPANSPGAVPHRR